MILTEANYFSPEAEKMFMGSSSYREFFGTEGRKGCEARALAKKRGEYKEETSDAFLMGNYVDAHFSGTLDVFKAKTPALFKKNGELLAKYEHANVMIQRAEVDEYFMKTLSGGAQIIRQAEMFGIMWKIKMDSYHEGIAIVDAKTTRSIRKRHWVKDLGHITFVKYWGYDYQLAIYQKVDEIVTGKRLPVLIAAVSKEPVPDIEIIGIDQTTLDNCIKKIEDDSARLKQLLNDEVKPDRCGGCEYCRITKKLSKPIHFDEIPLEID